MKGFLALVSVVAAFALPNAAAADPSGPNVQQNVVASCSNGQTVVIKLRWGKTANELLFEGAKPGIKFALGENPKRQGYPGDFFSQSAPERRFPGTRLLEGVHC